MVCIHEADVGDPTYRFYGMCSSMSFGRKTVDYRTDASTVRCPRRPCIGFQRGLLVCCVDGVPIATLGFVVKSMMVIDDCLVLDGSAISEVATK